MGSDPELGGTTSGSLDNALCPDPYSLSSQGEVYDLVLDGMRSISARIGEANLFIGPPPSAAVRKFLESNGWESIRDVATAERVLQKIVEQGEGGTGDGPDSHH